LLETYLIIEIRYNIYKTRIFELSIYNFDV
jgi:hypothetical protein